MHNMNSGYREQAQAWLAKYCDLGWPCFPCLPRDKKPATSNGVYAATDDPAKLAALWRNPDCNVGLAAGVAWWALDVDGTEGVAKLQSLNPLPRTVTQRTGGGGYQLFFRADPTVRNRVEKRPKGNGGLDSRSWGGYVVAPPSVHPESRQPYRWLTGRGPGECALAVAPGWLTAMFRARDELSLPTADPKPFKSPRGLAAYVAKACENAHAEVSSTGKGGRNNTLNGCAYGLGRIVGAGFLSTSTAIEFLTDAALRCGLTRDEAHKTISSGLSAGIANPRTLELGN